MKRVSCWADSFEQLDGGRDAFGQEVVRSHGLVHPALQLDVLTHYHESHMFDYAIHRKAEGDDGPARSSS